MIERLSGRRHEVLTACRLLRVGDGRHASATVRSTVRFRPWDETLARWLLAELRNARRALNEIIALAHDVDDEDRIAQRIRFVANRALGTYEIVTEPRNATGRAEAATTR